MKSISAIDPAIMENMKHLIVKVHPTYQLKSKCVTWSCITTIHFVSSSSNTLGNIPSKNNARSAPTSTALTQVSQQE